MLKLNLHGKHVWTICNPSHLFYLPSDPLFLHSLDAVRTNIPSTYYQNSSPVPFQVSPQISKRRLPYYIPKTGLTSLPYRGFAMSPAMISRPAMLLLFVITVASITSGAQASRSIVFLPQPISSLDIINTTLHQGQNARCSYTVSIRTSCYSPTYTRDQISLAFGDAYGNQVYAPRIDDPASRAFERCSKDTYTVYGPCTYQICYVYLYRSGYDGWIPYDVTIYGYNSKAVTFTYNVNIPRDTWYGHNYCRSRAVKSAGNLGWNLLSIGSTLLYTLAGLFRG